LVVVMLPLHSHQYVFFLIMMPRPLSSTLFPYTTLFRSKSQASEPISTSGRGISLGAPVGSPGYSNLASACPMRRAATQIAVASGDRKSTRLNSSHLGSSYAVFCLKKKKGYDGLDVICRH